MKEVKGACRFCGQIAMVNMPDSAEQDEIDEEVTLICGCKDAITYQFRKHFRETAEAYIEQLIESDDIKAVLKTLAGFISEGIIKGGVVSRDEYKYSISCGKSGPKVSVTQTHKESIE